MKKIVFYATMLVIVLSSCSKDEFDKMVIQIEGLVTNSKTGQVVEGAKVWVMTNGGEKSTVSDAKGYFNLGDLTLGSYVVVAEKDSFLTATDEIGSYGYPRLDGNSKEVVNIELELAPLSETLTFTMFKRYQSSSVATAAVNKPYTLYLGKFKDPISGFTDQNGLISLDNMPFAVSGLSDLYLNVDFEETGIRYKQQFSYYSLTSGSATVYGYIEEGALGIVSCNLLDEKGVGVQDFIISGNIIVDFTQPIDTINVDKDNINLAVSFSMSWKKGGMQLIINPGTNFTRDREYQLYLSSFRNASNTRSFSQSISFHTEE